jgi:uncharacterized protein with HEPN domain
MIRPSLRIQDYLEHIVEAIDRIDAYTAGISEAAFITDRKTQDAVIRNLQIIGEAAHNLRQRSQISSRRIPSFLGVQPTECATH